MLQPRIAVWLRGTSLIVPIEIGGGSAVGTAAVGASAAAAVGASAAAAVGASAAGAAVAAPAAVGAAAAGAAVAAAAGAVGVAAGAPPQAATIVPAAPSAAIRRKSRRVRFSFLMGWCLLKHLP